MSNSTQPPTSIIDIKVSIIEVYYYFYNFQEEKDIYLSI